MDSIARQNGYKVLRIRHNQKEAGIQKLRKLLEATPQVDETPHTSGAEKNAPAVAAHTTPPAQQAKKPQIQKR